LLWYVVIPISGAIMIGYTLRDLWALLFGRTESTSNREAHG